MKNKSCHPISSSITDLFLVPDPVPDHSKLSIAFRFLVHTPSHFSFLLQKSLPQPLQLPIRPSAEVLAPCRLRTISKELPESLRSTPAVPLLYSLRSEGHNMDVSGIKPHALKQTSSPASPPFINVLICHLSSTLASLQQVIIHLLTQPYSKHVLNIEHQDGK